MPSIRRSGTITLVSLCIYQVLTALKVRSKYSILLCYCYHKKRMCGVLSSGIILYMKKIVTEHNHLIDKIALANALLSGVTLYPQLFTLLQSEADIQSISILSFGLILSNSLIWLWYGVHRKTYPLIISSSLNAIASASIVMVLI